MVESKAQLPRVTFRFTDDLRARLESAAAANQRSVNAEVVARLEVSFEDQAELERLRSEAAEFEPRLAELREAHETIRERLDRQSDFEKQAGEIRQMVKELKDYIIHNDIPDEKRKVAGQIMDLDD